MSTFDNRKNITRTADAESFIATITEGTYACSATIQYKKGFKQGAPSITARTMDGLMAALAKQDDTVKFYKSTINASLSAKDEAALETMRTNPATSDKSYRSACHSFGQPPKARPDFNAPQVAPVVVVGLPQQGLAMLRFSEQHPELMENGHEDYNFGKIHEWHEAEQRQVTAESLQQCYAEIYSHGMFRDRTSGMRGGNIVRPFDMGLIRSDRAKNTPAAPRAINQTQAASLRVASKADVIRAARQQVLASRPDLNPGYGRDSDELRKLIDAVIVANARAEKPSLGAKASTDPYAGYRG
jgi:hypothetical protein